MSAFAAVTTADGSFNEPDVAGVGARTADGAGVCAGSTRAFAETDAQMKQAEMMTNARNFRNVILIRFGARGSCRIVERRPVIAPYRPGTGAPRPSQARRGAPFDA